MAFFATDHGFHAEPATLTIHAGDTFRIHCALGIAEYRVLRRYRYPGCSAWETVFERWLTPVEPFRQGFVGLIEVFTTDKILAAMQEG